MVLLLLVFVEAAASSVASTSIAAAVVVPAVAVSVLPVGAVGAVAPAGLAEAVPVLDVSEVPVTAAIMRRSDWAVISIALSSVSAVGGLWRNLSALICDSFTIDANCLNSSVPNTLQVKIG